VVEDVEEAGEAARALRDAGFRDAVGLPGRPASTPHILSHHVHPIDWIFVSGTPNSQSQVHHDIHASDHDPVSATLADPYAAF